MIRIIMNKINDQIIKLREREVKISIAQIDNCFLNRKQTNQKRKCLTTASTYQNYRSSKNNLNKLYSNLLYIY